MTAKYQLATIVFAVVGLLGTASPALATPVPGTSRKVNSHLGARTYPLRHPYAGRVVAVDAKSITLRYPAGAEAPTTRISLHGAYFRVGFYPVARPILRLHQHVAVLGAQSLHPIIMLLPAAHGTLTRQTQGWALATRHQTLSLTLTRPALLGGARLQSGEAVEVFGRRSTDAIQTDYIAARPHLERALVTGVKDGQVGLRLANGTEATFPFVSLPPELSEHLTQLAPNTPVLTVLSPEGTVLGVLPFKAFWHDPGESHSPRRPSD